MSLSNLSIVIRVLGTLTGTVDLSTLTDVLRRNYTKSFTDGAGAGQAQIWWHDQRTLGASATENIDLAGALPGMFGGTLTFTAIKAVIVLASAANNPANEVQVTRPAANGAPLFMAAGDGISLAPGAIFVWVDPGATGKAITAGTADLLTVTNSAGTNSVTYDIIVVGEGS